ncbi:YeiH family protein [Halorubrum ezzemoulense]|uniref:YeiH family protein n=1 Tax=Halorubrum ezzemoulense TaxID=337243 RepID=UPI00232C88AF|nr:putative sulfate exporter family transporter [Halorubrum ezzemoulense]MDB9252850.1 putative sulfate exporter family transporter [Halorubrum ezzemoulense]MDB9256767.1 putative sulfate exporter family transporter [Halorubrum ezzemoulense]MDB9277075.1 putative sulfate exporter family transporter [Halorubrum ezzemoulense]
MTGIGEAVRAYLPGLALLAGGAVAATLVADAVPGLQPLVVAVGIGVGLGSTVGIPEIAEPGVSADKLFLETGIVLLGAAVAVEEFLAAGPTVLGLVVAVVAGGLLFAEVVARGLFRIGSPTSSLLAAGASICGVSAVVAIGRVLDARGTAITFAAATILLFDAATLVAFPLAGEWLGLTGRQFGVWAGVSMFSTGPVAAAGFAYSPEAGQWATVTKLARNSLLGGVAVAYSLAYAARSAADPGVRRLWAEFPKFLLGFLAVAAVANSGLLSPAALASIGRVSDALFALAFVGLGLSIRVDDMRAVGAAPVGAVLVHLLAVSAVALAAVRWLL